MRQIKITTQGPLGWGDTVEVFNESTLLTMATGIVKSAGHMREGDILVRFSHQPGVSQLWTIIEVKWVRRENK